MTANANNHHRRTAQVGDSVASEAREGARNHLEALKAKRSEVERLRELAAEHDASMTDSLGAEEQALEGLQSRRESVLADIVAGEADDAALVEIDRELGALLKDSDGSRAEKLQRFRDASQTLAGLRRKLESAKADLSELEHETREVLKQLVLAEAEQVGAEYVQHANALCESFARLSGLNALVVEVVGSESAGFLHSGGWPLFLPAARLAAFNEADGHDVGAGVLFSADREARSGRYLKQRQWEVERLAEEGLSDLFREVLSGRR
ncbi:hypothetical protein [Aquisalimonas asiatica]|uniref:Uncharacterized protein n=1 Tax=Aquisalimonas asiatica TaxID=406100 RepID=A0A1H8RTQ0_9GAMM|nr:hypothetical protein [Aquisalimonas asiatica]SEO69313.1 hypothetical protein SAMN04488052_102220 [Aquisalimonas asiatica]